MIRATKRELKRIWVWMFGRKLFLAVNRSVFHLAAWSLGYDVFEQRQLVGGRWTGGGQFTVPPQIGFYKTPLGQVVTQRAKTVWDVGAHQGHWTLAYLSECTTPATINVHLFEPNPELHENLSARFRSISGVTASRLALHSKPGVMTFALPNQGSSQGFLTEDQNVLEDLGSRYSGNKAVDMTLQVAVSTVDEEVAKGGVAPDLLKIDVEGNVLHVLRGAANTLLESPQLVVEFEGDYSWMAYRNQIVKILGDRTIFRILPSGELIPAIGYFDSELYAYCDLIALPAALLEEFAAKQR